jgi:hypothetical protein
MARSSSRETAKPYNVFLSWSGDRSLHVAKYFRDWLPKVLQRARPWLSEVDIEKGTMGLDAIKDALAGMRVGIFFLTPENRESIWMHYEAGGLSHELGRTRVCTYLLAGLQLHHVKGPLAAFQRTKPDKDDTRKLIHTINRAIGDELVSDSDLNETFDKWWPDLELRLEQMPQAEGIPKPPPSNEEMIAEILELNRAAANRGKQREWMDQLDAEAKDVLPALFQILKSVNLNQLLPAPTPPPPPREPLAVFCIKLTGDPDIKKVPGTVAAVTAKGEVAVVVGNEVVARFESVEGWWKETPNTLPAMRASSED